MNAAQKYAEELQKMTAKFASENDITTGEVVGCLESYKFQLLLIKWEDNRTQKDDLSN